VPSRIAGLGFRARSSRPGPTPGRERERIEQRLEPVRVERPPSGQAALQDTIEQLLDSLHGFRDVLQVGSRAEQRQIVRRFLAEVRVQKAAGQAILRWYRLPRNLSTMLVELRGVEPLTPRLPASCSPN
jgi:hypothetical protein